MKICKSWEKLNNKIFKCYFKFQNPLLLVKNVYKTNQAKNEKMVNLVNDSLIDLNNDVNKNLIRES